ncbi:cytochrome b reductase 1 isoform X3 [Folsomia candida]|uniref:Cytochrome b reductase 1 n=1 Tax=Folsomia candida TaxID=158441 RepID=A0A226EM73_FOLCA|nr:cytochrome b reductase 1 isoform X3 [Folsomia candida]OXA58732.1 Cytochrome b reductase 1 [Folsomia candida]
MAERDRDESWPMTRDDSDDFRKTKEEAGMGTKIGFVFSLIVTSVLLIASLVLVLFWIFMYRGSYAWQENPRIEFNWHPTLMIGGFIFCSGFSMLFYRMMTCCRKIYVKLLHTVFHALSIACIAIGFLTVWDAHELVTPKIPHFYSLHSWLGLTTMGLFAIQFVIGFFSFLILLCCEGATAACRASLVPTHATFGIITFVMACATACAGLTEKAIFELGASSYSHWSSPESIIVNVLGITIAASAISLVFTLSVPSIRKMPMRMTYHTDL